MKKNFRRGALLCFKTFLLSETFIDKSGISQFAVGSFLSHCTEKHWRGTILCFRKVLVSKTSMPKRGSGNTTFGRYFIVSQYRNFSLRRNLLCFRKFRVSKKFMLKTGISLFSVDFFCLTVPKRFVEEHFCVSENFWYPKMLKMRGAEEDGRNIKTFRRKFFV